MCDPGVGSASPQGGRAQNSGPRRDPRRTGTVRAIIRCQRRSVTGTGMTGGGNTVVARCIFWNNGTDTRGVDREDNIFADPMLTDGFCPRLGNPAINASVAI